MGKKPRSQRRKKGKSMQGASSGDDCDDDDHDDYNGDNDDRRADLLSESFTIADSGSVYSTSNFDDDFTAGTSLLQQHFCVHNMATLYRSPRILRG